jgi:hypothetical protein
LFADDNAPAIAAIAPTIAIAATPSVNAEAIPAAPISTDSSSPMFLSIQKA